MASARGQMQFGQETFGAPVRSSQAPAQPFTLPVYMGTGAPSHEASVDPNEEPEESMLRLLRIHSDARIAFASCVATYVPNGCFALFVLQQVCPI